MNTADKALSAKIKGKFWAINRQGHVKQVCPYTRTHSASYGVYSSLEEFAQKRLGVSINNQQTKRG